MVRTGISFKIFAFCMDENCYSRLVEMNLQGVQPVSLHQLEDFDKELFSVKKTRSLVEYYFTSTPSICNYVLSNFSQIDSITYLDSDLYFFSSPQVVFEEITESSIAIVEHRFSRFGRHFIKNGKFNVAWLTFRNNELGTKCLRDYRGQCLEWCYDYLDGDRYGDQKYLDKWPEKYDGVKIIQNLGVNLAPWNLSNYLIERKEEGIYVNNNKLVFFHFANLKQLGSNLFTTSVSSYFEFVPSVVKNYIYLPYLKELIKNTEIEDVTKKTVNPKYQRFSIKRSLKNVLRFIRLYFFGDLIRV